MNGSSAGIFAFLKEARRHSEPTVDATAKALHRFEEYTKYRDFKAFRVEQAAPFKRHLADQKGAQSGERLSKATLHATLTQLKRFFQWLAGQPGYKISSAVSTVLRVQESPAADAAVAEQCGYGDLR